MPTTEEYKRNVGYYKKYYELNKKNYRDYYLKNKSKILKKVKEWVVKNKDKVREYRKNYKSPKKECMLCHKVKQYHSKGLCVKCYHKQYSKIYYSKNKEEVNKKAVIRVKEWRLKNPEKTKIQRKINAGRERKKYPEKIKARLEANNKIKIPKNKMCEICKINKAEHKHHGDYTKPLEIKFVCISCHNQLHKIGIDRG